MCAIHGVSNPSNWIKIKLSLATRHFNSMNWTYWVLFSKQTLRSAISTDFQSKHNNACPSIKFVGSVSDSRVAQIQNEFSWKWPRLKWLRKNENRHSSTLCLPLECRMQAQCKSKTAAQTNKWKMPRIFSLKMQVAYRAFPNESHQMHCNTNVEKKSFKLTNKINSVN